MYKAVTPVIAVTLLILVTILISASAFFWISSIQSRTEESVSGSLETQSGLGCSKVNLISMRGDKITVQNTGCDTIDSIMILIDGVLTNYTLVEPIDPGESTIISFASLPESEEHTIEIVLDNGFTSVMTSSALQNTYEAGYMTDGLWYKSCPAWSTVVDWNSKTVFDRADTLTCTCNSTVETINYITNSGFENNFTGWTPQPGDETINISTDFFHSGTRSVLIKSANEDYNIQPALRYEGLDAKAVKLYVNSSVNTSSTSFTALRVAFEKSGDSKSLFYIFFQNGFSGICNSYYPGYESSIYVFCIDSLTENIWNEVIVYPSRDVAEKFVINTSLYTANINLVVGGTTEAYFDDVLASESPEGEYCNKNNSAIAEGLCYHENCINMYLDEFTNTNLFLTSENATFVNPFISFAPSQTCNLNVNGTDYPMTIFGSTVSRTIPKLAKNNYFSNATCSTNNATISRAMYFSTDYLKQNWTIETTSSLNAAVGDIDLLNPGKEIIVGNGEGVFVYSTSGVLIHEFNHSKGYPLDMTSSGVIRVADVNNDAKNEVIFSLFSDEDAISRRLYGFNSSYEFFLNITVPNLQNNPAIAIADINSSIPGLEIISANNVTEAYTWNGTLLWNTTVCSSPLINSVHGNLGASIDDINIDNPGYEIVLGSNTTLFMLSSNGEILYSYSVPNSGFDIITTPAVAELNSSSPGKEIFYAFYQSDQTFKSYLFNSTLSPLWNYNFAANSLRPPIIGDVNGDGEPEIVINSNNNFLHILYKNGTLINIINKTGNVIFSPIITEIYESNPGSELVFRNVINASNYTLYNLIPSNYFNKNYLTDDLDLDGYLELISDDTFRISYYKTASSATTTAWPTYHHDNRNTGYVPN